MKQLLENFHKYLNEVEFGEEEAGIIKPDTPENTANFCKGKQNGTQVPQEIVYAINRDDKSKYVCYKETIMSAEQAYKHIAGVEKEAKPSVSPRTRSEAFKQDIKIRNELGINKQFIDLGARDEYKEAKRRWKLKSYKWRCPKNKLVFYPYFVYTTSLKADNGFKLPPGDECNKVGNQELWFKKGEGDPAKDDQDRVRSCGREVKCQKGGRKKFQKKKPSWSYYARQTDQAQPFHHMGGMGRGSAVNLLYTKPYYIPTPSLWSPTARAALKLQRAARAFKKATGWQVFPATVAPGAATVAGVIKPARLQRQAGGSYIELWAAKKLVYRTRTTDTPVEDLSSHRLQAYKRCPDDKCRKYVTTNKEKILMPIGPVRRLILIRDDDAKNKIKLIFRPDKKTYEKLFKTA